MLVVLNISVHEVGGKSAEWSGYRANTGERLYVGLSRATDRLVVVGDPEVIEPVAGPEVLQRLQRGSAPFGRE